MTSQIHAKICELTSPVREVIQARKATITIEDKLNLMLDIICKHFDEDREDVISISRKGEFLKARLFFCHIAVVDYNTNKAIVAPIINRDRTTLYRTINRTNGYLTVNDSWFIFQHNECLKKVKIALDMMLK